MLPFCTSLSQAIDESLLMNLIENAHSVTIAASLTSQNTALTVQSVCQKLTAQKSAEFKITINEYLSALHCMSHFSSVIASSHTLHLNFIFASALKNVITSQHHTLSNFSILLFAHTDTTLMLHHNHYVNNKLNSLCCLHCSKHISNNIS